MQTLQYTSAMKDLYALIAKAGDIPWKDMEGRPLVVQEVRGNHGVISHWVLCVNGSPPRGVILYAPGSLECWLFVNGRVRTLRNERYSKVERVLNHLRRQLNEGGE